MTALGFTVLVQNAALLLALAVVVDLVPERFVGRRGRTQQVAAGVLVGVLGIAVMATPLTFAPGIVFDTRSVVLSVSGLFFGPLPTVIAMLMTAALRIVNGGAATLTGIAVIVASGWIGIAWGHLRLRTGATIPLRERYAFGVAIHVVMLGLMFTLPLPTALNVLGAIAVPVMVIYPAATALLASLLSIRLQRQVVRTALAESEERLRLALDAGQLGLYDLDVQTGEATVNDRYALMLGYDPAEFHETNAAWIERLHPDDREPVAATYLAYVEGRTPEYRVEFRQLTKDGSWKWILSHGRLVERDASGEPRRMLGTHMDISAQRAGAEASREAAARTAQLLEQETRLRAALLSVAEDQRATVAGLRESEERYRSLVEHSPLAIFVNRDDRLTLVNAACVRLFGAEDAAELLGRSPLELFHPDDLPAIEERIRRLRVDGEPVGARVERIVRIDGSMLEVEVAAAPFEDHGVRAIHVVLQDVSARLRAEREILDMNEALEARVRERTARLANANRELEGFSYSVSHDLRAPLRSITGFAEILDRRFRSQLDEQGQHYLDNILEAGAHMGVLIEELLEYSRLGRGQVRREPVPLEPILERLTTTFAERIAATGTTLELATPLAVPLGDPLLVEQILANLLDNALTYRRTDVTPQVTIAAVRGGDTVALSIADNGIGIAQAHQEKIFEVFARLHRDDEYPGTGIGLATVRKSARLMGSDVTLTSVEGEGTTFTFVLPAAEAETETGEGTGSPTRAARARATTAPVPGGAE